MTVTEQVRPRFTMDDVDILIEALNFYADSLDTKQRELRNDRKQFTSHPERSKIIKKIRTCEKVVIQLKRITGEIKPYSDTPIYEHHRAIF